MKLNHLLLSLIVATISCKSTPTDSKALSADSSGNYVDDGMTQFSLEGIEQTRDTIIKGNDSHRFIIGFENTMDRTITCKIKLAIYDIEANKPRTTGEATTLTFAPYQEHISIKNYRATDLPKQMKDTFRSTISCLMGRQWSTPVALRKRPEAVANKPVPPTAPEPVSADPKKSSGNQPSVGSFSGDRYIVSFKALRDSECIVTVKDSTHSDSKMSEDVIVAVRKGREYSYDFVIGSGKNVQHSVNCQPHA